MKTVNPRFQRAIIDKIDQSLMIIRSNFDGWLPDNFIDFSKLKEIIIHNLIQKFSDSMNDVQEAADWILIRLGDNEENSPIMMTNFLVFNEIKKIFEKFCNFLEKSAEQEYEKLTLWAKYKTGKSIINVDCNHLLIFSGMDPDVVINQLRIVKKLLNSDESLLQIMLKNTEQGTFIYDLASALLDEPRLKEFICKVLSIKDSKELTELLDEDVVNQHKWSKVLIYIIVLCIEALEKNIDIDNLMLP